ncbi:hypothetical protein COO60DRAFT_1509583 [Scenedesmus sp. NREL 46B-D3]|nr:hypothetical protein COO60DRAFT_1509583 [Scenedesmus sp. NREL 46B-D3]
MWQVMQALRATLLAGCAQHQWQGPKLQSSAVQAKGIHRVCIQQRNVALRCVSMVSVNRNHLRQVALGSPASR